MPVRLFLVSRNSWRHLFFCRFLAEGKDANTFRYDKTNIKADHGKKYRCLQRSYLEYDKDDDKFKNIVDFYVTDDENHIPIRLDMFLRFGSAKAFLVNIKGERNPITSVVK